VIEEWSQLPIVCEHRAQPCDLRLEEFAAGVAVNPKHQLGFGSGYVSGSRRPELPCMGCNNTGPLATPALFVDNDKQAP